LQDEIQIDVRVVKGGISAVNQLVTGYL